MAHVEQPRWKWSERANPWCLIGMAWLAVVRGLAYMAGTWTEGYRIPAALDIVMTSIWQIGIAGAVWVLVGVMFGISVVTGWKLRWMASWLIGVKLAWLTLHLVAFIVDPLWNTLLSASIHAVLTVTLFTLVQIEIKKHREDRSREVRCT